MGAESYSSVRYTDTLFTYPLCREVRGCHSAINGRELPDEIGWVTCKMGSATAYQNRRTMSDELSKAVRAFEKKERRRQRMHRKKRRGY
jgi:hypothetical protein